MKNYVLFMVLAVLLFASACSEPMDTTVAHYEPTEKNQADFAELEQRLADVNAAVAELTDETGCVALKTMRLLSPPRKPMGRLP